MVIYTRDGSKPSCKHIFSAKCSFESESFNLPAALSKPRLLQTKGFFVVDLDQEIIELGTELSVQYVKFFKSYFGGV